MSGELRFPLGLAGRTITASVYLFGQTTAAAFGISMTDPSGTGDYIGNMPVVAAGEYVVIFFSSGKQMGAGSLSWDGTKEITRSSSTAPSVDQIATRLLTTPANKLATNTDGSVNVTGGVAITNYITVPAAVAIASQDPAVITCLRGDTLTVSLPVMGNIATRTKLVMTAKASVADTDAQAVLQIVEGSGLVRLNGSGTGIVGAASLTVTNATTGAVNLRIDAAATGQLAVRDLAWDCQVFLTTGIATPISGMLSVVPDVTQAVI